MDLRILQLSLGVMGLMYLLPPVGLYTVADPSAVVPVAVPYSMVEPAMIESLEVVK